MKEIRYFYAPDVERRELHPEEVEHVVKVLRYKVGDRLNLVDGKGNLYEAEIKERNKRSVEFEILSKRTVPSTWKGKLHLVMAPTKNVERTEWILEKATEIGLDRVTMVDCEFSERHTVNMARMERIMVSAMKQSHKALLPEVEGMVAFKELMKIPFKGKKYIAHCYDEEEFCKGGKPFLLNALMENETGEDVCVMVGPEGDFSINEVRLAIEEGFIPINLGKSRLRTETAALVAVHLMNIAASR